MNEEIYSHGISEAGDRVLPVVVEVGEKEVLIIDTGKVAIKTAPVYVLTMSELNVKKLS
jgi:hypothetical protein